MIRIGYIALLGLLVPSVALSAELKPERIDGSPLWPVHYYTPAPAHKIEGLVIMISDRQGWDARATALARHLTESGEVVVGLDLPVYVAALKKETNDCVLVTRDLEILSRDVERDLPFSEFRPPLILGIGAGSGLAYAAVGQVLPNTFAGGIGLGFDPVIDVGHKLCLPLVPTPPGAPLRYGPAPDHDTPFLFSPAPSFAPEVAAFLTGMPQAHLISDTSNDFAVVDTAVGQVRRVGKPEISIDGLPIVELSPSSAVANGSLPLIIFYSGDGGWRDIDKKIGASLADRGYFVVGIDSLRYFWRRKEPHEMASDLDRLIRHYHARFQDSGVILVGYSFGADLLPFMVNRLPADTRSDIKLISLLGIADRASFEIRLQGILGASNKDGPPTLPEIEKLRTIPVQCVFGSDEHDSVCDEKALDGIVMRDQMTGGHHFNGDYHFIADLIVGADKARMDRTK